MKRENAFKYVVSNLVIFIVVGGIFTVTLFSMPAVSVSTDNSVIYKGSNENALSLMFNVYTGTEYIQPMLDTMSEKNVKATFFVGGSWVEDNEDILKLISSSGHEIGNHGYLHKNHSSLSRQGNLSEIDLTHRIVRDITGVEMTLFAPPSGDYSDITVDVANELGYKTIMWTKDTIDWRDQDVDLIINRATADMSGGNLILMHPTKATASALGDIIDKIINSKYSLLPVSMVI